MLQTISQGNGEILVFLRRKPFLGAQIALLPFFHFLRADHPKARITAISPGNSTALLERFGCVDRVVCYTDKDPAMWRMAPELHRTPSTGYQLRAASLRLTLFARAATRGPLTGYSGWLSWLHGGGCRFRTDQYLAQSYLDLLGRSMNEFHATLPPRIPQKYALLIPGGMNWYKKYPHFAKVGKHLADRLEVHILAGPDMTEEVEELAASGFPCVTHRNLPLEEVAIIVRNAAVVVANDCGPAHFAHLYDIPRVLLFAGTTKIAHWFLPTTNSRVLHSGCWADIGDIAPERVLEAVAELLGKARSQG
jgi:ADP-heptose:LPS heptosyltransferase